MRRRASLVAAFLAVAGGLAGCSPFELEPPDSAQVTIEGPPDHTIEVVTSTHFLEGSDAGEDVVFQSADTAQVTLPFSREYAIELVDDHYRFFIRASALGDEGGDVRMRILIDGEPWYDEQWDLAERAHRFFYIR